MSRVALALLFVLVLTTTGWAQKAGLSGREGHARTRFPLTVWTEPFDDVFERTASRAMDDWNAVALDVLEVRAFQIVTFGPPTPDAGSALDRETLLYVVVVHELGHALGLPHVDDPHSLMCCREWRGSEHRATLAAFSEAIKQPDIRSVRDQLAAHYAAFWALDVP